jgi:hypothetical protein
MATAIVARIDELFAIEAEARRQALSLEALEESKLNTTNWQPGPVQG